ncbi:hypothetical protein Tco_0363042 [Tanacetum coccineum]
MDQGEIDAIMVIAGKGDTYADMDKLCVSFSPVLIQTHKLLLISGMHVPKAVFVDLEPSLIDEVRNGRIRILAFRLLVCGLREKRKLGFSSFRSPQANIRNSENEIHAVGLFLQRRVFSHGRLYVVVSRVKSKKGLKVLCALRADGTYHVSSFCTKHAFCSVGGVDSSAGGLLLLSTVGTWLLGVVGEIGSIGWLGVIWVGSSSLVTVASGC